MPAAIHRTAVFAVHEPTQRVRAALERVFRDYTRAYTDILHACEQFGVDELRGMATYAMDEKTGKPRMNARTLGAKLFADARVARTAEGLCLVLEGRLRQSMKEHVARTLLSYVALADAHTLDPTTGGIPRRPRRLRAHEVERVRTSALTDIAHLANNVVAERRLAARLQQTAQPQAVSIPFVGVDPRYGCGLYYNYRTRTFYARLDVVSSKSRIAKPIRARGVYTDVKSGVRYASAEEMLAIRASYGGALGVRGSPYGDVVSFGRGGKSLLVPLAMGQWHERGMRHIDAVAFLPQREIDPRSPAPATPVSAHLVRRASTLADQPPRYELHVAFEIPAEAIPHDDLTEQTRPLLALNRGIHHLVAAVVTTPDASGVLAATAVGGAELRALQEAHERIRRARQVRGVAGSSVRLSVRDRRQARLAEHHVAQCANQIADLAAKYRAQVVIEELSGFASGHALRHMPDVNPAVRRAILRTILNRRQFEKVHHAIDQRLELLGLPPARTVSAAYISRTCIRCGLVSQNANTTEHDQRIFQCSHCGFQEDIDTLAAANIARKLTWLRLRRDQKKEGLAEDARTPWDAWAAAHPLTVPLDALADQRSGDDGGEGQAASANRPPHARRSR